MSKTKVPAGVYGPAHDGALDPLRPGNRFGLRQRLFGDPERLAEEQDRRESVNPVTRSLQAAADRATGGRR